jgi:elongation factor Ts
MEIKATDVKALREKTGAGMMECKNALMECGGDFAKAEKLLKEKGLAAVEKRADRATNEGKVFVKVKPGKAILVEISCETDFVAATTTSSSSGTKSSSGPQPRATTQVNDDFPAWSLTWPRRSREHGP